MAARFGFMPVASVMVEGAEALDAIIGSYAAALRGIGGEVPTGEELGVTPPLFFLVATGGTEGQIVDTVMHRPEALRTEPVCLVAHPGNNSLPASLEVLAKLQQDGLSGRIIYMRAPDDADALNAIALAAYDLAVRRALRNARIGLIGPPSDWLVASMPTSKAVHQTWGPEVIPVGLGDLVGRISAVSEEDAAAAADELVASATGCVEPTRDELLDVARVMVGLKALAADKRLNALTVRCFDLVLSLKTTGCFALAELTDAGIIAGCEGDIVTTIGLLWTRLMTGKTPWMANPAQLDEDANTLWLAHCTIPRSMVESYKLRSHFESGIGVGIQGVIANGPVTLVRIGGTSMERIWIAEGAIVASGDAENLCRTQAQIKLSDGHVSDLLTAPLGNHIVLVPGHHAARLRSWWEAMI